MPNREFNMKSFLLTAALAVVTITSFNTVALAANVGLSLNIGQPGFYGRLDLGNYPQPRVLYRQPMLIERRVPMNRPPIYLRVPPGHAKKWSKHCREYNACGERVLFVQDSWYRRDYMPRYQEQQRGQGNEGRGEHNNNNGNNRGHGRDR
jgi:hypothetical protein